MFWDNFVSLCNQQLKSPNGVCAELGLSSAIATRWKNGSIPRDTTLKKIADYFGITVEDLLRDPDEQPTPAAEPAATSPLSQEFHDLLGQMTLQDLVELKTLMEEKIKNRK